MHPGPGYHNFQQCHFTHVGTLVHEYNMPQVFFDLTSFSGRPVSTSESARRHARLMHETRNICRMAALSPEEKREAYKLLTEH